MNRRPLEGRNAILYQTSLGDFSNLPSTGEQNEDSQLRIFKFRSIDQRSLATTFLSASAKSETSWRVL